MHPVRILSFANDSFSGDSIVIRASDKPGNIAEEEKVI